MKRIILLLCVLTLVGILASCARASDKTQEQTKQNEIEVSFEDTKESSDAISLDKKETMEQTGYTIAVRKLWNKQDIQSLFRLHIRLHPVIPAL